MEKRGFDVSSYIIGDENSDRNRFEAKHLMGVLIKVGTFTEHLALVVSMFMSVNVIITDIIFTYPMN